MIKRRTFFGFLAAIIDSMYSPKIVLASSNGISKPNNINNANDLEKWIKSWGRTQYKSKKMGLVKETSSGRILKHQEYGIGVTVNIDKFIKEKASEETIKEFLRQPSHERELLYKAVSQSLYTIVSAIEGDIYWRFPPEHGVFIEYEFMPNDDGPDMDFLTNRRGHKQLKYGTIQHYCRFAIDNDRYVFLGNKHIDMSKHEGGRMQIFSPKELES